MSEHRKGAIPLTDQARGQTTQFSIVDHNYCGIYLSVYYSDTKWYIVTL